MITVIVPARALPRLQRSGDLPFTLCPVEPAIADGAVVTLAERGGRRVGLALVDRDAACLRVMATDDGVEGLDAAWASARIEAARAIRDAHGVTGADAAYRLVNGAGDLVPGVILDVYGAFAVASALSSALVPVATTLADALIARGDVRGAIVKHRGRGRVTGPVPMDVRGEAPPERLVVREGPLRFEVHLAAGVNVGLFTDMRDERPIVGRLAHGRRVLNLFAYTGAFSVAALSGGASHVTSVDLSEGVLAWARDHVALNGLDATRHTTAAADVAQYSRRRASAATRSTSC
ncbi:MAG: class I SAM-dependent methyltransferase [Vicinamibacterales bacterium]